MGARRDWVGDGDGWIITATVCTPYCVRGRSRNSEGVARAPTCTLNLATLMGSQGRWYSILVQSPPFNLSSHLAPSPVTAANLAGAGLPELWGRVSRNEVPLCCGWPVELRQGGCPEPFTPAQRKTLPTFPLPRRASQSKQTTTNHLEHTPLLCRPLLCTSPRPHAARSVAHFPLCLLFSYLRGA